MALQAVLLKTRIRDFNLVKVKARDKASEAGSSHRTELRGKTSTRKHAMDPLRRASPPSRSSDAGSRVCAGQLGSAACWGVCSQDPVGWEKQGCAEGGGRNSLLRSQPGSCTLTSPVTTGEFNCFLFGIFLARGLFSVSINITLVFHCSG